MEHNNLENRVGFQLSMTAHLIQNKHNRSLTEYQLTRSQARVLYLLRSKGEQTQAQLQRQLHIQGSTMNGLIDSLNKHALILKQDSSEDRRRKQIGLTEKGESLEKSVSAATLQIEKELTEGLSEEELEHFLQTLIKMQQKLKEEE